MTPSTYLAFDLGATSGRAVLGTLEGGRLETDEVHRFATPLVEREGGLFWDIEALWGELQTGLRRALERAPGLRALSVDAWAVDYVPLGADGQPLRAPYSYRDPRTRGRLQDLLRRVPAADWYRHTGIQLMEINTSVQLLADVETSPGEVEQTATRLFMAGYFHYRLCGRAAVDRSMASTTQLMNVESGRWDFDLMERAGLPTQGWPLIVPCGTDLGALRDEALPEGIALPDPSPRVVASCSHDTAAAVAAVPADPEGPGWAYISLGTWALTGAECAAPVLTDASQTANFTNEAGLGGTVRYLRNGMGMWVLEECLREWAEQGERPDYDTLWADAKAAGAPAATLDLDVPRFSHRGDMLGRLRTACAEQGLPEPTTRGQAVRLILESLAAGYAATLDELERLTETPIGVVHVVGGGARSRLVCQMIADRARRTVVAGPAEATALGNLLVAADTLGDLPPGATVRSIVREMAELRTHHPSGTPVSPSSV